MGEVKTNRHETARLGTAGLPQATPYHRPVMLEESVAGLAVRPDGVYADVTFGGGGHSRAILDRLTTGHLYAFDQDEDAARNAFSDPRFTFIPQNFRYFKNFIRLYAGGPIDGVIADLGVSSHQFDTPEKGFSTRFDGRLDMRMSQSALTDAATVVNTYDLDELTRILAFYGEVQQARLVATDIVMAREAGPIETTAQLKEAVRRRLPHGLENKVLAQIFQALRIEVNQELEALTAFLSQCPDVVKSGGRVVVLSYHSLEDRLVKNFFKAGNAEGKVEKDFFGNLITPYNIITRKPLLPSEEEVGGNSRARSAKLRIAERR